jgi:thiamine monophosphate synthase
MINKIFYKHYVFLEELNPLLKKKLLKFKNLYIIINIDQNDKKSLEKQNSIVQFAKKNRIPFLFKNSFQKCTKYNASGIFLDSKYKLITKPLLLKKQFGVIGSVHNQLEYTLKIKQGCELVMLSPIFYNEKYSKYKILGPLKFKNMTLSWKLRLCALGGINSKTLKRLSLTKVRDLAFRKFIYQA